MVSDTVYGQIYAKGQKYGTINISFSPYRERTKDSIVKGQHNMEEIMTVPIELEGKANEISRFRSRIKAYLTAFGECYDKFTVTGNDTFLGYVSETAVKKYIDNNYGDKYKVHSWSDYFDIERIEYAVLNNISDPVEIEYVRTFFYDKYDLEIIEKKSGKRIFVDVKTAETSKKPQLTWDFLYPVVQNSREGKDCVILCYYYKQGNVKRIILVGYISENEISKKKILKAGQRTKFGTINQIDNYETKVTDYKPLSSMLEKQLF